MPGSFIRTGDLLSYNFRCKEKVDLGLLVALWSLPYKVLCSGMVLTVKITRGKSVDNFAQSATRHVELITRIVSSFNGKVEHSIKAS